MYSRSAHGISAPVPHSDRFGPLAATARRSEGKEDGIRLRSRFLDANTCGCTKATPLEREPLLSLERLSRVGRTVNKDKLQTKDDLLSYTRQTFASHFFKCTNLTRHCGKQPQSQKHAAGFILQGLRGKYFLAVLKPLYRFQVVFHIFSSFKDCSSCGNLNRLPSQHCQSLSLR